MIPSMACCPKCGQPFDNDSTVATDVCHCMGTGNRKIYPAPEAPEKPLPKKPPCPGQRDIYGKRKRR